MLAIKRALFALLITMFACVNLYAAQDAAIVVSLEGDAWVQRDSLQYALKLKTPLFKSDKIITEANAKIQLLFSDDTSLTIGPASELVIDDFIFNTNEKPKFAVKLAKGAARVISGKVVEQNPDGFTIGTPRTTVGIRGTDVVWNTGSFVDRILVNQIAKGHTVAFRNLESGATTIVRQQGTLVTANINTNNFTVERVPVNGNLQLIMEILGTKTVATGANANKGNSDATVAVGKGSFENTMSGFDVAEKDHIATEKDDYISNIVQKPLNDGISGYYRGGITSGGVGVFGFKADLAKGTLSDAYLSAKSGSVSFSAAGGGGALVKSDNSYQFNLGGFTVAGRPYPDVSGTRVTFEGVLDQDSTKIDWVYYENINEMILSGQGEGSKYWNTTGGAPQEIYANFSGTLAGSDGKNNGVFGFLANLSVGTLSNAYMSANSRYGSVHATGGTGAIYRPYNTAEGAYQFLATNFNVTTGGVYSEINNGSIFGDIAGDALNGRWEANSSSGDYISGTVTGEKGDFGQVPDVPKNDVIAAFKGTLAGDGISAGSFGFNTNLSKSTISSAYLVGTTARGSFLGVNGAGTLTKSGLLSSLFSVSGFTMSGNGIFATVDSALFESGAINYGTDGATLNAILKSGDTTLGLYTGTGSYSESLGDIPTLPDYTPTAIYTGSINDSDVYNGSFGFKLDLVNSAISSAYIAGSTIGGHFLATNGSGLLIHGGLSSTFGISGFDVSGNGLYASSTDMNVTNGLIDSSHNVTFDYALSGGGNNLTGSGTGGFSESLGDIPTLPSYDPMATYKGNTFFNGSTDNAGTFGFNVNLASGRVQDYYMTLEHVSGIYIASGGKGTLDSDKSFEIESLPIYNAGFGSIFAEIEGKLIGTNTLIDWKLEDVAGNELYTGTGKGSHQSGGAPAIYAHYAGLSSKAGVTSAMGFSVNTAAGTVSNAYFFEDSMYGRITATGGSGVVSTDPLNNTTIVAGGFNVVGTGMNSPANVGGMNALYDSTSFQGIWSAGYVNSGTYNEANGNISGSAGAQGAVPDIPLDTTTVAHYRGELDANSHFNRGTTGFDVNFNAASDHVSNAFIHGFVGTNNQIIATGGSGSLDMKMGHATYDINNFTSVDGRGSFAGYTQAEINGTINRNSNTNPLNWEMSGSGVPNMNGTANIEITTTPGPIPSIPTIP